MRRLDLDLIALPLRSVELTELGRVPDDRVADGDAAEARGEG